MKTYGACLANYNYAQYLPRCLEGLAKQTRPPDEIVIVEDDSDDQSMEVIRRFAPQFKKVTILQNAGNLGCNRSFNRAFDHISTDYVACCATDDWVSPTYFEKMSALVEKYPSVQIAACATTIWDEDRNQRWVSGKCVTEVAGYLSREELIRLDRADRLFIFGNTVLVDRNCLRELGGFDPELLHAADSFVWSSIFFHTGLCYDPSPLANCRVSVKSFSGQVKAKGMIKKRALLAYLNKYKRESLEPVKEAIRESGHLVHAGREILPLLWADRSLWNLLSFVFLRRYVKWNWWRLCNRYLQQSWLRWLQPCIPILQRDDVHRS